MNDKRFEAWWASNPARVTLDTAAKEVARKIWCAAQNDLESQLRVAQLCLCDNDVGLDCRIVAHKVVKP